MTLAIAFKSPEGIVLAADSRVTLKFEAQQAAQAGTAARTLELTQYYDHAVKLLKFGKPYSHIGAVTYGTGVIDPNSPRTAHSFLSEFETSLNGERLSVGDFATKLGEFFAAQFTAANMPAGIEDMVFLVCGYNEGETYGRVYEVKVPSRPTAVELNAGSFGLSMGGQTDIAARLLSGLQIPYQFLPLQDCVDLSILTIKTTADIMKYITGPRGVGGAIDVATITRTSGVEDVQFKKIQGERR